MKMSGEETELCSKCEQDIPTANFSMHSAHCERYLTSCPHCKEYVNKRLLDEHIEENHAKVKCDACKEIVEKVELESHKEKSCKRRSINCPYCEISLPAADMTEHKEPCGSRTDECEKCQKRVLIKNMKHHELSECGLPEKQAENRKFMTDEKPKMPHRSNGPYYPSRLFPNAYPRTTKHNIASRDFGFPINQNDFHNSRSSSDEDVMETLRNIRSTYSTKVPSVDKDTNYLAPQDYTTKRSNDRGDNNVLNNGRIRKPEVSINYLGGEKTTVRGAGLFGNYPDSDHNMEQEEEFLGRDLSDETFLPCEFCDEMLPADAIAVHQAICVEEKSFSTYPHELSSYPKHDSPPFSRDPPSSVFNDFYNDPLQLDEATAVAISSTNRSSDEETAPCEFCADSFPLGNLATHQVMCSENPHIQDFGSPPKRRSSPVLSSPPTASLPLPITTTPTQSIPPPKPLLPKASGTASNTSSKLAPKFSKPDVPAQRTIKTKSRLRSFEGPPERSRQNLKPCDDGATVKNSSSTPKCFSEVNQLGNREETAHKPRDRATDARKPFDSHLKDSSTKQNAVNTGDDPVRNSSSTRKNFGEINLVGNSAPFPRKPRDVATNARKPFDSHFKDSSTRRTNGGTVAALETGTSSRPSDATAGSRGKTQGGKPVRNKRRPSHLSNSRGARTTSRGSSVVTITPSNNSENMARNEKRFGGGVANPSPTGSTRGRQAKPRIVTFNQPESNSRNVASERQLSGDVMSLEGLGLNESSTQLGPGQSNGSGHRLGGSGRGGGRGGTRRGRGGSSRGAGSRGGVRGGIY